MPRLKAEKPELTHTQYKDLIWKSWKKSPDNPLNKEPSSVHVYPDWAAVQAYYGAGGMPAAYYNPAAAPGHAAHPYMWAPQMVPPYGSPYAVMYPHGGIYGASTAPAESYPSGGLFLISSLLLIKLLLL